MRERRVRVTRAQGRRRLRVLLAVLSVVLLAFVAFGITRSPLLAVERIVVEGASATDQNAIIDNSGLHDGDPILWADLGAAARRIEALPWIDTAEVTRDLPRTLRITVTERIPIAWVRGPDVGEGGPVGLVDADGRLLAVVAEVPPLPEAVGVAFDDFTPGATSSEPGALEVLAGLPEALVTQVATVTVTGGGAAVVVTLAGGPEIHMGDTTDVATKGSAALAVLDAIGTEPVAVIDVSVPSAPTTRAVADPVPEQPEIVDSTPATG